jgi:hypothetical protein
VWTHTIGKLSISDDDIQQDKHIHLYTKDFLVLLKLVQEDTEDEYESKSLKLLMTMMRLQAMALTVHDQMETYTWE